LNLEYEARVIAAAFNGVGRLESVMLFGTICIASLVSQAQTGPDEKVSGVPEVYAGNWICQSAVPGYNVRPWHADPSQPLTGNLTTPPSVQILKFALRTDGTYESARGNGHYAFDRATNTIDWLDGPHQREFSKTQLGRRDDGAAKIGLTLNNRYYGCFMPKAK
jgi:hypothetical protein